MDLAKIDYLDIILVCGLYGSGKNEFAMKYFRDKDRSRISRSDIRKYLYEMTHFGEPWRADRFAQSRQVLRPLAAATVPYESARTTDCGRR